MSSSSTSSGQEPLPLHTDTHSTPEQSPEENEKHNKWKKKEDYKRTCLGIKRATADGGHFCGMRRRGSFWVEQGAVGVSTLLFQNLVILFLFSGPSVELPPPGDASVGVVQMLGRHTEARTLEATRRFFFFFSPLSPLFFFWRRCLQCCLHFLTASTC